MDSNDVGLVLVVIHGSSRLRRNDMLAQLHEL